MKLCSKFRITGTIVRFKTTPKVFLINTTRCGDTSARYFLNTLVDRAPKKAATTSRVSPLLSEIGTFKPLVAVAALSENVVTATTLVAAPGVFMFGRRPYHDSNRNGYGMITIYEAIERSSNVFFFKMGIALGVDKMFAYLNPLGIGQKTGVELAREVAGTMPNSEWKKATVGEEWQPGETLSTAIGQGFVEATPISGPACV